MNRMVDVSSRHSCGDMAVTRVAREHPFVTTVIMRAHLLLVHLEWGHGKECSSYSMTSRASEISRSLITTYTPGSRPFL